MLVYPENTIWAGREKQARRNYGRTHFSWLPVIENKLQIGWWHGISDINNVSSDWVTAPLICWEKATHTHTLPAQHEIKIERAGSGEKNVRQGDEKREGDAETEDSLFHLRSWKHLMVLAADISLHSQYVVKWSRTCPGPPVLSLHALSVIFALLFSWLN